MIGLNCASLTLATGFLGLKLSMDTIIQFGYHHVIYVFAVKSL